MNMLGVPVMRNPWLPDGQVVMTTFRAVPAAGPILLVGTHSTELSRAAREARLTVRRGLADVLAWLGQPVENEPTGEEILAGLRARAGT